MLSRALSLAAVAILICCFTTVPVGAQNLEAGKSPAQIFSGACAACHKSGRGLLRTVAPGSLPGFLRQHYTTSGGMASTLSAFLIANGAADPRAVAAAAKRGPDIRDPRQELPAAAGAPDPATTKQGRRPRPDPQSQQAARPDADGLAAGGEAGARSPPNTKQAARSGTEVGRLGAPSREQASLPADGAPKIDKQGGKRGRLSAEEPASTEPAKPEQPTSVAARDPVPQVEPARSDAAIDAAIPLPEQVDLPPPTIADFKVEPVPAATPTPESAPSAGPPVSMPPAQSAAIAAAPVAVSAPPVPVPLPVPGAPPAPPISR